MPRVQLAQEVVDEASKHLESAGISEVALLEMLTRLPDLEYGAGDRPLDVDLCCRKCEEPIEDGQMMGDAMGHLYHDRCVPSLARGPMPRGQYLAGEAP